MVSVILRAPLLAVFCGVYFPIADRCLRTYDNIPTNNGGQNCAGYGMNCTGSPSPPSWILTLFLTVSSAIFNALTILDIGLAPRTKPWHCIRTCHRIAQTNFKLATIWLPWLLISSITPARADAILDELMETIIGECLKMFCRVILDRPLLTGASFLAYVVLVSYCLRILVPSQSSRRTRSIWSFFLDYLLNPETISHWNELGLAPDSQLESLISHLAMPNLWLTTTVPTDYLKYLPTWHFSQQLVNSDINALLEDSKIVSQRKTRKKCYGGPAAAVFREAAPHDFRGSTLTGCQESTMCQGLVGSADCAICLEKYELNVVLCALPCGHYFHKNCIMAWLERDNHHCPICRWAAYRSK